MTDDRDLTPPRTTLSTTWLEGCSGCHMSFLDLDERLLEVHALADLVYSPLVDMKDYPDHVDVCLVEGGVSTEDDLVKIRMLREGTTTLVALGDCAVTTNVPGMRNPIGLGPLFERAYIETADINPSYPDRIVPKHLPKVLPVHKVVHVDVFLPGCPPSADVIYDALMHLLDGRPQRDVHVARFGR